MNRRFFLLQILQPRAVLARQAIYDAENEFASAFNAWVPRLDQMLGNGIVDRRVLGERTHLEALWMKFEKRVREWERGA